MKMGAVGNIEPTLKALYSSANDPAWIGDALARADHVKTIHVLSEKNPIVDVVRFHVGPQAGRARISTNIRLATTQREHRSTDANRERIVAGPHARHDLELGARHEAELEQAPRDRRGLFVAEGLAIVDDRENGAVLTLHQ